MHTTTKRCLLNPGPVTLSPAVRAAMQQADLCHREPQYAALQARLRTQLTAIYPACAGTYTTVRLNGSGTCAVEAMVGSLVPCDGRALVLSNGVYGERIEAMLTAQHKPHHALRHGHTEPLDLQKIEAELASGLYTHAIAVHHETTTGRLNDIAAVGELCRKYDAGLLLDAVSSFGGEAIQFEPWNLEAVAATANKCLHGVPGLAFVVTRRDVLAKRTSAAPSIYLDLFNHYSAQEKGYPAFTPPVQCAYALEAALEELMAQGGWPARHAHYNALSTQLRSRLRELSLCTLLPDADNSATLTTFHLPEGVRFDDLFTSLEQRGFVIYPGQQLLAGTVFRIAVMGHLDEADVDRFADALRDSLEALNTNAPAPTANDVV